MDIHYQINFYSDWHCGSGLSAGSDVDLLVIKDRNNLPFVPGKTIKGLVREAVEEICLLSGNNSSATIDLINKVFGSNDATRGEAFFTNAVLEKGLQKALCQQAQLTNYLYRTIASTAIDSLGIAEDQSLRKMQTTIPCVLEGTILNVSNDFLPQMRNALKYIKRLGQNRNRGLGRCVLSILSETDSSNEESESKPVDSNKHCLTFRCTLLTDVVLNQKAATEGNQSSLDFIPGSNFLGIVASAYKSFKNEDALTVFHSGKVRFGDAHPEKGGKLSLHIPASYYQPKLKPAEGDADKGLYIHHEVANLQDADYKSFHPKQCRSGFYLFESLEDKKHLIEVKSNKSFAIKSAYDRSKRRSEDEKMYGYESLEEGATYMFDVCFDQTVPKELIEQLRNTLIGKRRVGRSRTAQYGLVDIEEVQTKDYLKYTETERDYVLVYAHARLIFLDDYGLPTFQPTASDLGFADGDIVWGKSQIRTFQYAPFNFKRQTRDTDRCGIEKGSVFYIKLNAKQTRKGENWVGSYWNEGFGRVLLNPDFLNASVNSNGKAKYIVSKVDEPKATPATPLHEVMLDNAVYKYLQDQQSYELNEMNAYKLVNEFVENHKAYFKSETFASQWGTIRTLAMLHTVPSDRQLAIIEFLTHGVAKAKWDERGRLGMLESFIDIADSLGETASQLAIINLAAEMAKINTGGKQ